MPATSYTREGYDRAKRKRKEKIDANIDKWSEENPNVSLEFPQENRRRKTEAKFVTQEEKDLLSKLLRKMKGDKSLRVFAAELGTNYQNVHNWINALSFPENRFLRQIAAYNQMSYSALLLYLQGESTDLKSIIDSVATLDKEESLELILYLIEQQLSISAIAKVCQFGIKKLANSV